MKNNKKVIKQSVIKHERESVFFQKLRHKLEKFGKENEEYFVSPDMMVGYIAGIYDIPVKLAAKFYYRMSAKSQNSLLKKLAKDQKESREQEATN